MRLIKMIFDVYSFMFLNEREKIKIKQEPHSLNEKKKRKERLEIRRKEKLNRARI